MATERGIDRGAYFELPFQLLSRFDNDPLNISTWEFRADFRSDPADTDPVLTTTTSGGHWVVPDGQGVNGKLRLVLTPEQTAALPLGILHADLMRTDSALGRMKLIASLRIPVGDPITRST